MVFLSPRKGCLPFPLVHWAMPDSSWTLQPVRRSGVQASSADWDLHKRGAGPSFLLFEGPLGAPLLAWLLEGKGHKTGVLARALRDFTSKLVLAFFKTSCVLVKWLKMNCSMLSFCWWVVFRRSAVH